MKEHLLICLFPMVMQQPDVVVVQPSKLILQPGVPAILVLNITVKEGYHIQSSQPSNEFLIPTAIVFENDKNINPGKADFPEPKKFKLENSDEWFDVYDSSFQVKIPVEAAKKIKEGNYNLKAKLHYQACDVRTCFFPKDVFFTVPYNVNK